MLIEDTRIHCLYVPFSGPVFDSDASLLLSHVQKDQNMKQPRGAKIFCVTDILLRDKHNLRPVFIVFGTSFGDTQQ